MAIKKRQGPSGDGKNVKENYETPVNRQQNGGNKVGPGKSSMKNKTEDMETNLDDEADLRPPAVSYAKKILHGIEPRQRAYLYLIIITLLSLVADYFDTARGSHLISRNILNEYFVKLGWFWTFTMTGLFILTTSIGSSKLGFSLCMSLMRLGVGTGVWFSMTQVLFPYIEHKSGVCQETQHLTKRTCGRAGFLWTGFDTSGHCFLLIWNCLYIIEESKAFVSWQRINEYIQKEEKDHAKQGENKQLKLSESELKHLKDKYDLFNPWVEMCFVGLGCFVMLWDFMTLNTILFFHTTTEKVLGCSFAILIWLVLYKFIYKLPLGPGIPGEGPMFKLYTKLGIRKQGKNCLTM